MKVKFEYCSDNCPAKTGKPYGSVRYCPMAELKRHRKFAEGPHGKNHGVSRRNRAGKWETYDWRTSVWVEVPALGKHVVPPHPDATDCCLNFQCCVPE